jgi:hypothetical protein
MTRPSRRQGQWHGLGMLSTILESKTVTFCWLPIGMAYTERQGSRDSSIPNAVKIPAC